MTTVEHVKACIDNNQHYMGERRHSPVPRQEAVVHWALYHSADDIEIDPLSESPSTYQLCPSCGVLYEFKRRPLSADEGQETEIEYVGKDAANGLWGGEVAVGHRACNSCERKSLEGYGIKVVGIQS